MKYQLKEVLLALIVVISVTGCEKPYLSEPSLERISYLSDVTGQEREFFLYLPRGYEQRDKWPVLLFLHGNGERGNGKDELEFARVHGPLYEAWVQKRDLPFVIINPQLPMFDQGEVSYIKNRSVENIPQRLSVGVPDRPDMFPSNRPMDGIPMDSLLPSRTPMNGWPALEEELVMMIKNIQQKYRGDASRTYISGISRGGFGTWYMASAYPELFAAALPVVAYPLLSQVESIANAQLPLWCIAGGRDQAVQIQYYYAGMNKLEQLGHTNFKFTIEADMNHDVWSRTYAGEDWYKWMLQYTKN